MHLRRVLESGSRHKCGHERASAPPNKRGRMTTGGSRRIVPRGDNRPARGRGGDGGDGSDSPDGSAASGDDSGYEYSDDAYTDMHIRVRRPTRPCSGCEALQEIVCSQGVRMSALEGRTNNTSTLGGLDHRVRALERELSRVAAMVDATSETTRLRNDLARTQHELRRMEARQQLLEEREVPPATTTDPDTASEDLARARNEGTPAPTPDHDSP